MTTMKLKTVRILFVLGLCVLASGCASLQQQWQAARAVDTIPAYESFLQKHPSGQYAPLAQSRLNELRADQDWYSALAADSLAAFEAFVGRYPWHAKASEARTRIEELKEDRDWRGLRYSSSAYAFEDFIRQHPQSPHIDEARARYQELVVPEDWRRATDENTIEAFEGFLQRHPESTYAAEANKHLNSLKAEQRDWDKARKRDTIKGYQTYLKQHPNSPFADVAAARIVDLEVADIMRQPHGDLPSASRIGGSSGGSYSTISIHNDTRYRLTIRYSGPESFKVVYAPHEKGAVEVLRGNYKVTASVDAANVQNYAGEEVSDGGEYESVYYIETVSSFGGRIPGSRYSNTWNGRQSYETYPIKRALPSRLR